LMALLVENGADINAPPAKYGGVTALQGAAIAGNIKIVMLLIEMGALVNAPPSEREGRMALDGAAEHGRLDTVQLLLTSGAECMEPGISGWDSAIRLAEGNGHFVIADILRENKGGFEEELFDLNWLNWFEPSLAN
ncbi:ankyrin, partial [Cadophora sp. DSE1049]